MAEDRAETKVPPEPAAAEVYLGDGLYASFDGWQIKLRAPRSDRDHIVYLEPEVMGALARYAAAISGRDDPAGSNDAQNSEDSSAA